MGDSAQGHHECGRVTAGHAVHASSSNQGLLFSLRIPLQGTAQHPSVPAWGAEGPWLHHSLSQHPRDVLPEPLRDTCCPQLGAILQHMSAFASLRAWLQAGSRGSVNEC